MATPFSDVYVKANVLFEDANLLGLDEEEYAELLELFLSKSKSIYFKNCKKDLNDVNEELKQFNNTIDEEEQWILAEGIKLVWAERELFKEKKMRNKLGLRDYKNHSEGNLIDKLTLLIKDARKVLKEFVVDYSFNDFEGFN